MPADHDVVGRELGDQLVDLARLLVTERVLTEHVAQPEHRPHRVADGVVELACLLARRSWLHCGKVPRDLRSRQLCRGDAGRDPHSVVRRAADREARQPLQLARGSWPPGRGGRRRTAAARHPTAARGVSTGRTESPIASARSCSASSTSSSSLRWSSCSSRWRPSEQRSTTTGSSAVAPASRTQSHLAKENVEAFTARPSTGGTRKPEPGTSGNAAAGKASVTIAIEAYSIRASASAGGRRSVGEQPGRGACRGGQHDGVRRRPAPGRGWGRRRGSSHRPGRRASSRTVAPVRTVAPRRAGELLGQPSHSPAQAGEDRRCRRVGRSGGGRGRMHQGAVLVEQRHELGYGGPGRDLAGVAGVHPAEQWLHQPVDDLLAQPLLDQVADADVAVAEVGRRQHRVHRRPGHAPSPTARRRGRAGRAGRPSGCAASGPAGRGSRGWPRWSPGAPGRRRARPRGPGPLASGRRLRIASAPTSVTTPADLGGAQAAPDARRGLQHHDLRVGRSCSSRCAAASPETPPPTTATTGLLLGSGTSTAWHSAARGTDPVSPASQHHDEEAGPAGHHSRGRPRRRRDGPRARQPGRRRPVRQDSASSGVASDLGRAAVRRAAEGGPGRRRPPGLGDPADDPRGHLDRSGHAAREGHGQGAVRGHPAGLVVGRVGRGRAELQRRPRPSLGEHDDAAGPERPLLRGDGRLRHPRQGRAAQPEVRGRHHQGDRHRRPGPRG